MKSVLIAAVLCMSPALVLADAGPPPAGSKPAKLNAQERAALDVAQRWQAQSAGMRPTGGAGGAVRFAYGVQPVNVVCAVLQVCDVALQPGEQVNNINLGDPRFSVEPALSGTGAEQVEHLIIKPQDTGLETMLVVTTDRRTYHIRLRSTHGEFMPTVSFTYPEDASMRWDEVRGRVARAHQAASAAEAGPAHPKDYAARLDFDYRVEGEAPWKPVRVFNDGVKTIVQMPAAMAQTEAPTLLVLRQEGGAFSDDETVLVNYRVQDDRYIVDAVFDKAILVAGVGKGQTRITIRRGK